MNSFTIVQASAGSGKTKILVDRYLDFLNQGEDSTSIICLTFTNAAAMEMLERVLAGLPKNCLSQNLDYRIQTIHSFCHDLIQKHFDKLDLAPAPTLLETPHELLRKVFQECVVTGCIPYEIANQMSEDRCFVLLSDLFDKRLRLSGEEPHPFFSFARDLLKRYDAFKRTLNVLDFHDLIVYASTLLKTLTLDPPIAHVLVDEAQDTSLEQWKVLFPLMSVSQTFFVVGDIKQSIYGFQGASPDTFEALPQKWEFASLMPLNTSYRTGQRVLDVVNQTFRASALSYFSGMNHISARNTDEGGVILLPLTHISKPQKKERQPFEPLDEVVHMSEHAENLSAYIVNLLASKRILAKTKQPIRPQDIMVLVQKRSQFVWDLITLLKQHDVPCSGPLRVPLTNSLMIQDVMALGTWSMMPSNDYNLACLLKSPLIGLGEDELFDLCAHREKTLFEELTERRHPCVSWLMRFQRGPTSLAPGPFYQRVWDRLKDKLLKFYGERMIMEAFLDQAWSYTQDDSLLHFHEKILKNPPMISPPQEHGVRILTVHGSKGLQAPVVILADATTSPSLRQDSFVFENGHMHIKAESEHLKPQALGKMQEDHQRLLYVAMTRAEDFLVLTGVQFPQENTWYHQIKTAIETLGV